MIAIKSLIDLPEQPDYSCQGAQLYVGEPLQAVNISNTGSKSHWLSAILQTDLTFEQVQEECRSGKYFLYAYGYVEYLDIWGQSHTHRFGVVRAVSSSIVTDNWTLAGPPTYNSASN